MSRFVSVGADGGVFLLTGELSMVSPEFRRVVYTYMNFAVRSLTGYRFLHATLCPGDASRHDHIQHHDEYFSHCCPHSSNHERQSFYFNNL
jgi:hypothetical protein